MSALLNILSFDIEEIFHGEFTRSLPNLKRNFRSEENIFTILNILQEYKSKATFFIVGQSITDNGILSELVKKGHEIAFHTQDHIPLREKTYSSFRDELGSFRRRIRESTGSDCIGFRAPSFSLDRSTYWAVECLRREGYVYDSSVFPIRGPLYGLPSAPMTSYEISEKDPGSIGNSGIIEFPLTVTQVFGLRIPVAGGFYLRAIPLPILIPLLDRALKTNGTLIIYSHNWELDPKIENISLPLKAELYCYFNIKNTIEKLRFLLERYRFVRFVDALQRSGQRTLSNDVS